MFARIVGNYASAIAANQHNFTNLRTSTLYVLCC